MVRRFAVGAYVAAVVVMVAVVASALSADEQAVRERAVATEARVAVGARDIPATYRLRKNDTLGGIAERFDLSVSDLVALNPRIDPMALDPGTTLRLREPTAHDAGGREARPRRARAKAKERVVSRQEETTHTIAPGETLTAVAARYGTTVQVLLELNPNVDPYSLVSGQQITVP